MERNATLGGAREMSSPSLTTVVLIGFGLVTAVLLVRGFLRRGKNLLERLEPLPGESLIGEHDVEISEKPRRGAVHVTLVFLRARARITTERVAVAQGGLFASSTLVLRFIAHRTGSFESAWEDGYGTFVVDTKKSGEAERNGVRELRVTSRDDSPILPPYYVLRGSDPALDAIAKALGIEGQKSRLDVS